MGLDGLFMLSRIFDSLESDAIAYTQRAQSGRRIAITPLTKAWMCEAGAANWFGGKILVLES